MGPHPCAADTAPGLIPTTTRLLDGPGFKVVDLAISRSVSLPGGSRLTFRAEATNAFNIVNYGQPGNSVPSGATSTTFGVIHSANAMRRVQLGVRWTF